MADSNSNSVKPTADLAGVACTLNGNAANLAGLAHLLGMLMLDHGHDAKLCSSLTALAGVAERASSDCLDAAASIEKIEWQSKVVSHV
jgi:hypothetical protein